LDYVSYTSGRRHRPERSACPCQHRISTSARSNSIS
jgi:hypothetical protein